MIVIRDNDPKGYDSGAGLQAERDCYVPVVPLPKRSPNVMPLDFTFHHTLKAVLKEETKNWAPNITETRNDFKARVLAAYASLTEEQIKKGCGDMKRRLQSMYDARGTSQCIN